MRSRRHPLFLRGENGGEKKGVGAGLLRLLLVSWFPTPARSHAVSAAAHRVVAQQETASWWRHDRPPAVKTDS